MENKEELNWENFSPTPEDTGEMKKIQKSIRKRHWITVLTSVAVVIALIIGAIYVGIPALESRYWDPEVSTYAEYTSDLEFAMCAYSELFVPTYNVNAVDTRKTGFASYDLSLLCFNEKNRHEYFWSNFSLDRSELDIPYGFWDYAVVGSFSKNDFNSQAVKVLKQLPEYVKVQANVAFPEDLDMYDIVELQSWLAEYTYVKSNSVDTDNTINWVAIRTSDDAKSVYPLCGMKPFTSTFANNIVGEINDYYPNYSIRQCTKATLEEHFLALLNYSIDQVNRGTGILPEYSKPSEDYYQSILDYVEENGIYSYGCTITATPQMLLELISNGTIANIHIQDVWIAF